jgi:hypothetical protein
MITLLCLLGNLQGWYQYVTQQFRDDRKMRLLVCNSLVKFVRNNHSLLVSVSTTEWLRLCESKDMSQPVYGSKRQPTLCPACFERLCIQGSTPILDYMDK